MVRAVRLGNATLLGGPHEALLGARAGDEVGERLGHERAQVHGQEYLGGQEDAREHGLVRALERPGDALECHARADAAAWQLSALGQVPRLEALHLEGADEQVPRELGLVRDHVGDRGAKQVDNAGRELLVVSHAGFSSIRVGLVRYKGGAGPAMRPYPAHRPKYAQIEGVYPNEP